MTKEELQAKARLKVKQRVQKSRRIKREKKAREGKRDPVTLRQIKPAQDNPDVLREGLSISVIDNPDLGVLSIAPRKRRRHVTRSTRRDAQGNIIEPRNEN